MFGSIFSIKKKRRESLIQNAVNDMSAAYTDRVFTGKLDEDVAFIKKLFENVDILRIRELENNYDKRLRFCLIYSDGMVDSLLMGQAIVNPLISAKIDPKAGKALADELLMRVVHVNEAVKATNLKAAIDAITYGDTVLIADGCKEVLFDTKHRGAG